MKKFSIFIWISLFSLLGFAQNLNLKFKHLTSKNGLVQNNVLVIRQDHKGFMWFGTRDGLSRFDGYSFKTFRNNPQDSTSLSNNFIRAIREDHEGKLWIGTVGGGLELYDAEKECFIHYKTDSKNPNSLCHSNVGNIVEDKDGNLWIGTIGGGLNVLDKSRKNFIKFTCNENDSASLSDNSVRVMLIDHENNLWIGFWGAGGLNKFDRKTKKFIRFRNDKTNPSSIGSNYVRALYEDEKGFLWIGTDGGGLNKFDPKTGRFTRYMHNPDDEYSISHNIITQIVKDDEGRLWLGTENGGLCLFDIRAGKFYKYQKDDIDQQSINSNSIYSIFKDQQGDIWIGTYSGGVNVYFKSFNTFENYKQNKNNPKSLSHNNVLCFNQDEYGNVWVGTDGGGLNRFDPQKNTFIAYKNDPKDPHSLGADYVVNTFIDSKKNLWIGTWTGGLNLYNYKTDNFKVFHHDKNNPNSLNSDRAWLSYEDHKGNLWVGTFYAGLDLYDNKTGKFRHFLHDPQNPKSISSNDITSITEDKYGRLWIGTDGGGLNLFDSEKNEFQRFRHSDTDSNSLSDDNILYVMKDHNGDLWYATNGGMSRLNPDRLNFKVYRTKDGLSNDMVLGILEDSKGYLWVSSNKGLSKFNPVTGESRNFSEIHGLQDVEFKRGSCFKDKNGYMYFGGINGFNRFHPDSIRLNSYIPSIVLTDFQIFNKSVKIGTKENELQKSITESKFIKLKYNQSVFSIEYAALNFNFSEEIEYAYKLDRFDKDWNYVGKKRMATYTNLDPGNYTFKVKCKVDGVWSDEVVNLSLKIMAPFWKTIWFRIVIIIFIIGLFALFYIIRLENIKRINARLTTMVNERTDEINQKNVILKGQANDLIEVNSLLTERQKQIEEQTEELLVQHEELSRANATKDKLFQILAHDLRSPFSILLGFSELLYKNIRSYPIEKAEEQIKIINETANSTFHLLENLLQWSKSQQGMIEYCPTDTDILSILASELRVLNKQALAKEIRIEVLFSGEQKTISADENMISSVIRNLISNAIKYSFKGSVISVMAQFYNSEVVVSIKDNGTGMDKVTRDKLFHIHEHSTKKGTKGEKGTGLGLLLCADFIAKHKGKIWVETEIDQGSTFFFSIPVA